jgi:sodium transport system permease protein
MLNSLFTKNAWRVIARKELKYSLRDRNAVLTVLLFPLFCPELVYFMFNQIIKLSTDVEDISLPVSGYEYAADLMDYLEQNNIGITQFGFELKNPQKYAEDAGQSDAAIIEQDRVDAVKAAIESRRYDFVLVVPVDFDKRISRSMPVNLELHVDGSRTKAQAKINRIEQLIRAWARETVTLRLLARGISPSVINPVELVQIDVAEEQARALRILSMIPMFTLMAAFICGIGVAIDATAGERERKTLEPLLVNPIARMQLVIGKWSVATLFSMTGIVLIIFLNLVVLKKLPLAQWGLVVNLNANIIIGILVILVPLAFLVTSMQMFVGMLARSFKEAQGYIAMMNFLPMIPYFMNAFDDQGREVWMSFVPIYGQHMLLNDVISGKTPQMWEFVLSALVIAAFTVFFLLITARLFKRERIIFS